ncbi:hypothetical protein H257_15991 [Aphanomyces astaci]|uniref:Retrotransposon gag domain-containing protein n=1 Tax=Aphanomyces astaci TaxID=112090 RepID=W4FK26_APHAT|nr:hypothetical protein H257_15991 [Aphanomyces astaci]ETV67867.1 hypothetical protein H257_15991 [Aphanomyces astaci]|eukprot:XP_009842612.1 hypothetical protein H257_15991 [Aphanomyces astaci]
MKIAMQAERSRLLSLRSELLRVPPPTPNHPNVVSAVGYETAYPFQRLATCVTRRSKYGEPRLVVLRFLPSTVMGSDFTTERTPVHGILPSKGSVTDKLDDIFDTLKTMQAPFLPMSHNIPVHMVGTRPLVMETAPTATSGHCDGGDGNDPRLYGEGVYGSVDTVEAVDQEEMVVIAVVIRLHRHSLVANARKQPLKLESVDNLQLDHFLEHLDDIQIEFELTYIELIRILSSNRTWRSTRCKFYKEFVQKSMSVKMAEITQNSALKAKETVRKYAWRINNAAQDLELRHSQAVQIFNEGCKDTGVASCIRGSETRPHTIQECLDYLRFGP